MSNVTRREFVRKAVLTAAATRIAVASLRGETAVSQTIQSTPDGKPGVPAVRWLDGSAPAAHPGTTWGMPWPRGRHAAGTTFTLRNNQGAEVPSQSWPLATWPDGSLKWTAHAVPAELPAAESFEILPGTPTGPAKPLSVREGPDQIEIDTGVIQARVAKKGL